MRGWMNRFLGSLLFSLLMSVTPLLAQTSSSSPHTLIIQPDDGRAAILSALQSATNYIDLTIYEINDPQITDALVQAAKRGVRVRMIYNYWSFIHMGRGDLEQGEVKILTEAGAQTKRAGSAFMVTHQKTFTIDDRLAIIMTFNLQPSYFDGTRDFGVITTDSSEIAEIKAVFDADWNYQPAAPSIPSLVWSPVNSRTKILDVIKGATQTLEVYNEEAKDPESLQALADAAKRGVKVRFITAFLGRGDVDGNIDGRAYLNSNGVMACVGTFLYIHAKMVLADYGTDNARVFLGSENFSKTSLNHNRELGIILLEPPILDRLHAVFEQDWLKAQAQPAPQPEAAAQ
jgi:phosphatidylserine/phosphatidylglycerophosphate/cardiolipin synthase-like enzyme